MQPDWVKLQMKIHFNFECRQSTWTSWAVELLYEIEHVDLGGHSLSLFLGVGGQDQWSNIAVLFVRAIILDIGPPEMQWSSPKFTRADNVQYGLRTWARYFLGERASLATILVFNFYHGSFSIARKIVDPKILGCLKGMFIYYSWMFIQNEIWWFVLLINQTTFRTM